MIACKDKIFRLTTADTSYWFRVTKFGHLEHIHYGARLPDAQPIDALLMKRTAKIGDCVLYDQTDFTYCLETLLLEWSDTGQGDYRHPPAELKMPDGTFSSDFVYRSHRIFDGHATPDTLPGAYGEPQDCQTLEITMQDSSNSIVLLHYYGVYAQTNIITRRTVLKNGNAKPLTVRKLMSMNVDLPNDGYRLLTFDGGWIKEANKHEREITYGLQVNASTTGRSSNRHNPGFILAAARATENSGNAFGFNLIYSGNHYGAVELSNHDRLRVQIGINPHCFEWKLNAGEVLETPEAMLTFSAQGLNGLSQNFHDFINNHIVRGHWKNRERPVLLNNWEAHFFKFDSGKLLRLARRAAKVGVELFVLDDGWFGARNDDTAGLGDYDVNRKKLPNGLAAFGKKINDLGMKFGLWFEPEMVNEDSDLFRAHPEWTLRTPNKKQTQGRNQLVLDLCNPKVRDYIVKNVTRILDNAPIDYVKWDCNRNISDAFSPCLDDQGRFFHAYTLGLYDVLHRIFAPRPHILLESCASGGNRFDAGMLCFSPQVWSSDNTDPVERLRIQGGLSYLYPPSTMGAHVSEAPHQQTLRATPLATRFNVAAFGCLGYELDLKFLSRQELQEVAAQIAFYKQHRRLLQYGKFSRGEAEKDNKVVWHCLARGKTVEVAAITGFFQTLATASEGFDRLRLPGLDPSLKYRISTKPQRVYIKRFGLLTKHILPVTLDPEGAIMRLVNRYYSLPDCAESYIAYGETLLNGIQLNNQYLGTGYNEQTRLLGDFGSNLYITERVGSGEHGDKAGTAQ